MNDNMLQYLFETLKAKYDIFEDGEDKYKTADVVGKIIATNDFDFIWFCNFYFFLYEQRINNGDDELHPITSTDIWPFINSARTAILKYLEEGNKKEYKRVEKYILTVFKKEVDEYEASIRNTYSDLKNKLSENNKLVLHMYYKKEFLEESDKLKYGTTFNNLAIQLIVINIIKDKIIEAKLLVKDSKRNKFNFWLSLSLAIFSIILGVASIIISLI